MQWSFSCREYSPKEASGRGLRRVACCCRSNSRRSRDSVSYCVMATVVKPECIKPEDKRRHGVKGGFTDGKPESPALSGRFSRLRAFRVLSRTGWKAILAYSPAGGSQSGGDQGRQTLAAGYPTPSPYPRELVATSPRPVLNVSAYDRLSKVFNPCSISVPPEHLFL